MPQKVTIGTQDFEELRTNDYFYIDKTNFIKEWWESGDKVTLITRPRRFGKTLNMNMMEVFFSIRYEGRGELFEGLSIWEEEKYRNLQGTYPVISLTFARVKEQNYTTTREKICEIITNLYIKYAFLRDSEVLTDKDREYFDRISTDMRDSDATSALYQLSDYLCRYYGKKVIILLDEYDTPMQEAYIHGYWEELLSFIRSLFNSAFKTNPYLERAIMTGITRGDIVAPSSLGSKIPRQVNEVSFPARFENISPSSQCQSVFSDLNNLEVVTTTSQKYANYFGFTEQEVFESLEKYSLSDKKEEVKKWYDGFTFGSITDIYNPWSIISFLSKKKFAPYWANTSSNGLVGKLIRSGSRDVKMIMEDLLRGNTFYTEVDEQIVFNHLDKKESAIWSLLLASGYLKVASYTFGEQRHRYLYGLQLTNLEVQMMFEDLVKGWFEETESDFNAFIKALLLDDLDAMNEYMNDVAVQIFSSFDTGNHPSKKQQPERFYHGFVLGLLVELRDRYLLTSNRESGFGRYDVILEPLEEDLDAIILEFKVHKPKREATLEDTVKAARIQIEEKGYATDLMAKGILRERIRCYGIAFEGKNVLIG